jgi:hypothetical protein
VRDGKAPFVIGKDLEKRIYHIVVPREVGAEFPLRQKL